MIEKTAKVVVSEYRSIKLLTNQSVFLKILENLNKEMVFTMTTYCHVVFFYFNFRGIKGPLD